MADIVRDIHLEFGHKTTVRISQANAAKITGRTLSDLRLFFMAHESPSEEFGRALRTLCEYNLEYIVTQTWSAA